MAMKADIGTDLKVGGSAQHGTLARARSHFFPSFRQLYLSFFFDTLRPTQRRSLQMLGVAVPQIGVGVFHA